MSFIIHFCSFCSYRIPVRSSRRLSKDTHCPRMFIKCSCCLFAMRNSSSPCLGLLPQLAEAGDCRRLCLGVGLLALLLLWLDAEDDAPPCHRPGAGGRGDLDAKAPAAHGPMGAAAALSQAATCAAFRAKGLSRHFFQVSQGFKSCGMPFRLHVSRVASCFSCFLALETGEARGVSTNWLRTYTGCCSPR